MQLFTVKKLINYVSQGEDFFLYVGAFLDDFYREPTLDRLEEPEKHVNVDQFYYCDVAAIAHKLANDYNLAVPEWTFKPEYILKEPYYEFNTENPEYMEYLKKVCPLEFKMRNIFVDTDSLKRV